MRRVRVSKPKTENFPIDETLGALRLNKEVTLVCAHTYTRVYTPTNMYNTHAEEHAYILLRFEIKKLR